VYNLELRITNEQAERLKKLCEKDRELWQKINQAIGWAIMEKDEAQKPITF
jgi:hypothetical protein